MRVPPGREAADRVLITPRSVTARGLEQVPELEPLRALGYRLVGTPPGRTPTREDLISALPGCVGWIAGVERIDQDILAAADGLRVISRNGAGVDAIKPGRGGAGRDLRRAGERCECPGCRGAHARARPVRAPLHRARVQSPAERGLVSPARTRARGSYGWRRGPRRDRPARGVDVHRPRVGTSSAATPSSRRRRA